MEQEPTPKDLAVRRLEAQLKRAAAARTPRQRDGAAQAARARLRQWQVARLARTHADLLVHPRYAAAARFFLEDLYGPQGRSADERMVSRALPLIKRTLPASGMETVADAIELDALSASLDADMAAALAESGGEDAAAHGDAYRRVGRREDRARQIALIGHLGGALERLTKAPFIGAALAAMRKPAQMAGFGDMQAFLERGYAAFRQMGDARAFVDTIMTREAAISAALFAGDDSPLDG